MLPTVAIIGSGPTGIYTMRGLVRSKVPLAITIFESEAEAGKGTPYHPDINDRAMLSNIASIELPPICETLVQWLRRQSDEELQRLEVPRVAIDDRAFYPRVVIGEFLQAQLNCLVDDGKAAGHTVEIKASHRVVDIELCKDDIRLTVQRGDGESLEAVFDHVVMATGHDWPESTETKPGYFVSPWPAPALKKIPPCKVGVLGTSLSGIDAVVTVATAHGRFLLDAGGHLQYLPLPSTEGLTLTMLSRKGVLPEADFYFEVPYRPLEICTEAAVDGLVKTRKQTLLDDLFDLFRRELAASDPDYAASIGLGMQTVETIARAYFKARESSDPFVWAARNLGEAEANKEQKHTVEWRYAILRMHEVIARAIPHLNERDLKRFHNHFKTVFVDDYATVPHESIRRMLALHRAGKLEIIALGDESEIDNASASRGAIVSFEERRLEFDVFIDATGQHALSAQDIPFPTLREQGVIRKATTRESGVMPDGQDEFVETGGVELDDKFRPVFEQNLSNHLYCAAISYLLHKLPFVQGITSARDMGEIISKAIQEAETLPSLSAA